MYKIYINDWNSNSTTIDSDRNGAIKVSVGFEDDGVEIITNCYNNFNCHLGEPRFDLSNSRVDVTIRPRFDEASSRFTFDAATAFNFEMAESGPCVDNVWAFICDWQLPDRESLLRAEVIKAFNKDLTDEDSRGRVMLETMLNSYAGNSGLRNVTVGPSGELIFF